MAPVPPGNLIFLQVQQTRLIHHVFNSDEDAATHISQYESPFEKIQVESTTIHHCHRLHETFSRHFALISRFLDRHPQVVTLILVVCLLLLLHVLLSTCNLNRAHDDTPEDKKSPSAQVDTSEMRKEG